MKEFIEEYGGVVAATLAGLILLNTITQLLANDGALSQLFILFAKGIGQISGL